MCNQPWIRMDEFTNAADYLLRAEAFIREAERDLMAWKWVVLALHGALYGFAVCFLDEGNVLNVIEGKRDKAEKRLKAGTARVIGFWEAIRRAASLSAEQEKSVELLHDVFRNRLVHFLSTGWSINACLMPQMAIDALEIIKYLVGDWRVQMHLGEQREEVEQAIDKGIECIENSALYREATGEAGEAR